MSSPLTDKINALTAYANEITGESDTTLSDAVASLASGYGGGGGSTGLEYEVGTYTAAADSNPTISFANAHSTVPVMVMLVDASGAFPDTTNKGAGCIFGNFDALVSGALVGGDGDQKDGIYGAVYRGTGTTFTGGGGARVPISSSVTASGFTPYFGSSARTLISGRTYKWLAVWK